MAKNPNKKVAPKDEPMNGAMKFFLAGCVAELYLLILRRFYINADSELTRIAWYDHYLWTLAGIGAGVLAVGVIAALVLRTDRVSAFLTRNYFMGKRPREKAVVSPGAFHAVPL